MRSIKWVVAVAIAAGALTVGVAGTAYAAGGNGKSMCSLATGGFNPGGITHFAPYGYPGLIADGCNPNRGLG